MDVLEQIKQIDAVHTKLNKKDQEAKKAGKLQGRFLQVQSGEGYAYYEIIRENKDTVVLKWIEIIGTKPFPTWGKDIKVEKEYAKKNIAFRDHWNKSLGK